MAWCTGRKKYFISPVLWVPHKITVTSWGELDGSDSLCAICLEPLGGGGTIDGGGSSSSSKSTIFTAECSHSFHFLCIASNIRHGNVTCPICRAQWSQLPRDLRVLPASHHHRSDPVLRILDDSIATSRVNRRSFVRTTRYNDDEPIDPASTVEPVHPSLQFALMPALIPVPVPTSPNPLGHYACGHVMPLHHEVHFTSLSLIAPQPSTSPYGQTRAYLSIRLAPQRATDLVLVASPNGPHIRLLKQAMALVVFSMRAIDRLAVVTYSTTATRAFPLRRMSPHAKRMALQVIDRLSYFNGADPIEGLQKASRILEDRTHRNPISCILQLSDSPVRAHLDGGGLDAPIPIHRFHVGFGFGTSNGFVMYEFEEFLARLLGGVVRETQLRIGEHGGVVRLGELRGGEERRIPLDLLGDCGLINVGYSYVEGGEGDQYRSGEVVVELGEKSAGNGSDIGGFEVGDRDLGFGGARRSCVDRWDYVDPFMARRWAKHLHGYKA
ncbi:hypothetical protein ACMD2_14316 [Ananas comosus]|uniref:RING-type domain-containing protein n=1 Tax=Ananas comosus TaxID=4615 RepID=A0A199UHN0_ANACO|nr:hypothetical protein ACMD2_14316 [Ananas comosus]